MTEQANIIVEPSGEFAIPPRDGLRVALEAIEVDHLMELKGWRNQVRSFTREWRLLSDDDQTAWHARMNGADRQRHVIFGIFNAASMRLIGAGGLTYIDWIARRAEVSLYIGHDMARGQGLGVDALAALLDFGFDEMNLNRVVAEVYSHNDPSLRLFSRFGFTEEGRLRQHVWKDGAFRDSVMFGLMRTEWRRGG